MPRSVMETPWVVLTSCASAVAGRMVAASQQRSVERIATSSSSRSVTRFGTTRATHVGMADALASRAGLGLPATLARGGRALAAPLGGRRFGGPTAKGLSHGVGPGFRSPAQFDPLQRPFVGTDPRGVL